MQLLDKNLYTPLPCTSTNSADVMMSSVEETLSAAASTVRGLARQGALAYDPPDFNLPQKNGAANRKVSLPGISIASKESLESELSALATRIQYLESKASTINHQILPDTPNDSGGPTSPFANGSTNTIRNGVSLPVRQLSGSSRHARVTNLLAGNNLTFTEDDLGHLRDHVEQQAEQIKSQNQTIVEVKEQLLKQKEHTARSFDVVKDENLEDVRRELWKHQQANDAFRKALREIGTIITNVANGDLSQKIQVHAKEMDSEIDSFKRTINTMVDQLQVFGNEVSRVALEVGTEGKLGGQAQISGVSGVWKDLTQNGE